MVAYNYFFGGGLREIDEGYIVPPYNLLPVAVQAFLMIWVQNSHTNHCEYSFLLGDGSTPFMKVLFSVWILLML